MPTNYKLLYEQMGKMVDMYQNEIVPQMRELLDKRVEVVRCHECKHRRPIDRTKSPEKYYKDGCVVCECEDVVGDEPMVYPPNHFCSYGERKEDAE